MRLKVVVAFMAGRMSTLNKDPPGENSSEAFTCMLPTFFNCWMVTGIIPQRHRTVANAIDAHLLVSINQIAVE